MRSRAAEASPPRSPAVATRQDWGVPELPEIETIRRQLATALEGRRLERLEVLDPRWCEPAPPEALEDAVRGRTVERLWRRGKYLVFFFNDAAHPAMYTLIIHNALPR